ncbi:hypothetical protein [Paenibacillus donghaensis]|uniref:Uncharacterized protein n=1 Tax=Paenibacillus donghaensis TaxID=414771 RepID=A0A2Z2KFF7_9BACL|nr:hypothetical protein [Paenibacillus donghaensis]ASA22715.1 hypothetical protein B9T62_19100 [Paenibacillus donghaensis]
MSATKECPVLNIKKIGIEDHAVKRVIQRYHRENKQDALNFCKSLLGNAKYIGETTCDKGNKAQMFVAPNKIQIYLSIDFSTIRTIMDSKEKSFIVYDKNDVVSDSDSHIFSKVKDIPLQDKLIKLYQTEFKKHDRLEKRMSKEFLDFKFMKQLEIAELNLLAHKTKSKQLRDESIDKVKHLEADISSNFNELKRVQDSKRQISKALASLLTV